MDDISLFLGFFSVIFAVFSCEMGVKIFYMPLFKPKKGGLELGRGTSKSNRITTKDELNRDPDLPAKYSSQELDYSYRIKDRFFKKDRKGIWGRYECAAKRNSHKCPATLQIHIFDIW